MVHNINSKLETSNFWSKVLGFHSPISWKPLW